MMMQGATLLALSASSVLAQGVSCVMEDRADLQFVIDRNQFADALNPNDPPRRKVSDVTYGDKRFPAEPFLIGDTLGFQAEGLGGSTMIFVMQADGSSVLTDTRAGLRVTGECKADD